METSTVVSWIETTGSWGQKNLKTGGPKPLKHTLGHRQCRAPVNTIICLFVKLSQEIHNKMPTLPSGETMLMTARIL